MNSVDLLGYIASFIIFISLTMRSAVKLRLINAAGSVLFVFFAFQTNSYPTAVLNAGIFFINVWFLWCMAQVKYAFEIVKIKKNNEILTHFYNAHQQEIETLFGKNAFDQSTHLAFFFRNDDIAGLLAYTETSFEQTKAADILIDFVTPQYRDYTIGRHFFVKDLRFWKTHGYGCLITSEPPHAQRTYIERIGFVRQGNSH